MPHVSFIVDKPTLRFSHDSFLPAPSWHLSYPIKLANRLHQHVDLSTGEKFDELDGHLGLKVASVEALGSSKRGSMSYWKGSDDPIFPHRPSYLVEIYVVDADLDRLGSHIDAMPLRSINIDVPALHYGWEPDGSGKKWDNAAQQFLDIEGFQFFFSQSERDLEDDLPPESSSPEPAAIEKHWYTDLTTILWVIAVMLIIQTILLKR